MLSSPIPEALELAVRESLADISPSQPQPLPKTLYNPNQLYLRAHPRHASPRLCTTHSTHPSAPPTTHPSPTYRQRPQSHPPNSQPLCRGTTPAPRAHKRVFFAFRVAREKPGFRDVPIGSRERALRTRRMDGFPQCWIRLGFHWGCVSG